MSIMYKHHLLKAVVETEARMWTVEQHGRPNEELETLKVMYVFVQWSVYRTYILACEMNLPLERISRTACSSLPDATDLSANRNCRISVNFSCNLKQQANDPRKRKGTESLSEM